MAFSYEGVNECAVGGCSIQLCPNGLQISNLRCKAVLKYDVAVGQIPKGVDSTVDQCQEYDESCQPGNVEDDPRTKAITTQKMFWR
jgi:hypothetical protein